MYAENLDARLLRVLGRPDLRVVSAARRISFDAALDTAFRVDPAGEVVLGAACLGTTRICAFHLRHALELSMLLDVAVHLPPGAPAQATPEALIPRDLPVLAGLCAARVAALFWQLDGPPGEAGSLPEPVAWIAAMAAAAPPPPETLKLVWRQVGFLQEASRRLRAASPGSGSGPGPGPRPGPGPGDDVPAAVLQRLGAIWRLLGPAERLMAQGGDQRLAVDPRTGLNHYGCSHRPRPWAITFASSTASSLSERGFGGAEASRQRIAAGAIAGRAEAVLATEAQAVRDGIAAHYGLISGKAAPAGEVVLAASGTDCELLVLALAERRGTVSTILTAPEETGTGVPLAAGGRHFASDTSGRQQVDKGMTVDGFRADTRVVALAIRRADGTSRTPCEIEADCAALIAGERRLGHRVLLHLLDLSKTGLLAPPLACLERLQAAHGEQLDIVVDACQARLDQRRVRDYLARGWMVMITGSKFFTGPPFCGAVLLPPPIAARLADGGKVPAGLAAYGSRTDWPAWAVAASNLPPEVNLGMALRWHAALAEMRAFGAVPPGQVRERLGFFLAGVRQAIGANPNLMLIEVPAPERAAWPASGGGGPEPSWDQLQTILSFLVLEPADGTPLSLERARQLYRWLNADVARALPATATDGERSLGRLLCHIGQPAPVAHHALAAQPAGALRISAGARLLSGEPSHEGLDAGGRLAREIADAGRVLDKISLLLRHWAALQAANPEPSYAPNS